MILGNVAYEALTGDDTTLCSLSAGAVSYLRSEMNYTGIIMTDSLSEDIITANYSSGEAAVAAVKAGVDLLYCPADFEEAYQAVLDAVDAGEISEDTIDQAVGYILTGKMATAENVQE
jgi:beta-N-acetylhexosaminidase